MYEEEAHTRFSAHQCGVRYNGLLARAQNTDAHEAKRTLEYQSHGNATRRHFRCSTRWDVELGQTGQTRELQPTQNKECNSETHSDLPCTTSRAVVPEPDNIRVTRSLLCPRWRVVREPSATTIDIHPEEAELTAAAIRYRDIVSHWCL